jgi:hypothetical protein
MAVFSILAGIGAAVTAGALSGTAAAVAGGVTVAAVGATVAGAATGIVSAATKGGGGGGSTPTQYNETAAKKSALEEASNVNKRRIQAQTDTTRTSALGSLNSASTGKKTLLGA